MRSDVRDNDEEPLHDEKDAPGDDGRHSIGFKPHGYESNGYNEVVLREATLTHFPHLERRAFVIGTVVSFTVVFTGCMVSGMCGGMMQDNSQSESDKLRHIKRERTLKEAIVGSYRIVAEFPPLMYGDKATPSLLVFTSGDSLWLDARVMMIVSLEDKKSMIENILLEEPLKPSQDGNYTYSFVPRENGVYHVSFLVEQLDRTPLEKPIIISMEQDVVAMETSNQSRGKISPLMLISGVLMATMMIVMIATRMF